MPCRKQVARSLLFLAMLLPLGCSERSLVGPGDAVPTGVWAGDQAIVTIAASGAHFEFACASGDITQPIVADRERRSVIEGLYYDERVPLVGAVAARYDSHFDNDTMTLVVTLIGSNQVVGPLNVTYMASTRLTKCR